MNEKHTCVNGNLAHDGEIKVPIFEVLAVASQGCLSKYIMVVLALEY